jgi:hypothetical protein
MLAGRKAESAIVSIIFNLNNVWHGRFSDPGMFRDGVGQDFDTM